MGSINQTSYGFQFGYIVDLNAQGLFAKVLARIMSLKEEVYLIG